jgi:hypothetical protein
MNKAFVREPESDGRAYCPRCGSLGIPVEHGPLDAHIRPESRNKLGDSALLRFVRARRSNLFDAVVQLDEPKRRYP